MAGPEDITLFSSVDHTKQPDFFKRFLDEGNKNPGIIASKPIILAGLHLTRGDQVLDAGCGLGDDTVEEMRTMQRMLFRASAASVNSMIALRCLHSCFYSHQSSCCRCTSWTSTPEPSGGMAIHSCRLSVRRVSS